MCHSSSHLLSVPHHHFPPKFWIFTTGAIPGEGVHSASNHLRAGSLSSTAHSSTLTISFDMAVLGVGFSTIDFFNTGATMTIEAFDAINGMGTSLGMASAVQSNFQRNGIYFMGVSESANVIRSLVFTQTNPINKGDVIGIDDITFAKGAQIPEPGTLAIFGLGLAGLGFARRKKAA